MRAQRASAAAAIVAIAALATSLQAAKTIVVTSTADRASNRGPAPPGSLREAIERLAGPGDTIRFEVSEPVRLETPLRIPSTLTGLTIEGPGTIAGGDRGALEILANNVTLQYLTLNNLTVLAGREGSVLSGPLLRSNSFTGDSTLGVIAAVSCAFDQNTFDVSDDRDTISLARTDGCVVSRNVITGPARWQIADAGSLGLIIDRNRLSGGLRTTQRSGVINENRLDGTGRIRINPSGLLDSVLLRVVGNVGPGITVRRTNIHITGNTLTPAAGETPTSALLRVENFDPLAPAGTVLIEKNSLSGGATALQYMGTPTSVPAVIRQNTIADCDSRGLFLRSPVATLVEQNEVSDCLVGIDVDSPGGSDVRIESNTVLRSDSVGLRVADVAESLVVKGNSIRLGQADGIAIQGGAGRTLLESNAISDNTGSGVLVTQAARAVLFRDHISKNGGAGVFVGADALASLSEVSTSLNTGLGIDVAPAGVTPNTRPKKANLDIDWPTQLAWAGGRLSGASAPASRVEVYIVESGPRSGNATNGEGLTFLFSTVADDAGRFDVAFPCSQGVILTATATLGDPAAADGMARTSEFSQDVSCVDGPPPPTDQDHDGVNDADDTCPGTTIGEIVDGNGCSATQRDDDLDGIANGQDRCPLSDPAGTVNADGCAVTVAVADAGVAYCSRADACGITSESGGTCTFCSIVRSDGLAGSCIDRGTCSLASNGYLESDGGLLFGPRGLLDCDEGECNAPPAAPVSCSAGAGRCQYITDTESASCPSDTACTMVVETRLLLDTNIPFDGEVTALLRHIVGFDTPTGITLKYRASVDDIPFADEVSLNSTTEAPNAAVHYRFAASLSTTSYEFVQSSAGTSLLEEIDCGGAGSADIVNRAVRFEVGGAFDASCLFKVKVPPLDDVITSLQLAPPVDLVVGTERATTQLTATATTSQGGTRDVTADPAVLFQSSNPAVVEVSNAPGTKGVITAKSAGEVTLTAQIPASPGQPVVTSPPVAARSGDPLVIITDELPGATDGQPYQAFVAALGGIGSRTFSTAGTYPPGIGLNAATGEIAGTATEGGNFIVGIKVADSSNGPQDAFKLYAIQVLKLRPAVLASGTVGTAYQSSAEAVGNHPSEFGATRVDFKVVSGQLPPGLDLMIVANETTSAAVFGGTPTEAGTFTFAVEVTDLVDGRKDTEQYTIEIAPKPQCAVTATGSYGEACGDDPATFSAGGDAVACQFCRIKLTGGEQVTCARNDSACVATSQRVSCTNCQAAGNAGVLQPPLLQDPSAPPAQNQIEIEGQQVGCSGQCELDLGANGRNACPEGETCDLAIERRLLNDPMLQRAELTVKKITENGDGQFTFFEVLNHPKGRSILTQGGVGRSSIKYVSAPAQAPTPENPLPGIAFVLGEHLPAGWIAEPIECTSGTAQPGPAPGTFAVVLTHGDVATCTYRNRKLPVGQVRATGVTLPEGMNETRTFGLPAGNRFTIAGANGFEIRDAVTDQVPIAGSESLAVLNGFSPYQSLYGALVVKNPSGDGSDALFVHGAFGYGIRHFDAASGLFGFTQVSFPPGQNYTDAIYFGDDPNANGVLTVNFTGNGVNAFVWRDFSGQIVFSGTSSSLVTRFAVGNSTGMVSAFASNLKFDPDGALLSETTGWIATVLDGTPGKLWISDPKLPFTPGTLVGDVGNSPRRIRCLPSHNLCAVSNFASDSLTIVQWNGRATAAITTTAAVGDGPVGIDLRADGVNAKVISTGFNDNTVTVTTVAPNGSVLSIETQAAPAGCVNPGHALWVSGLPGTAVITCKGSQKYALVAP